MALAKDYIFQTMVSKVANEIDGRDRARTVTSFHVADSMRRYSHSETKRERAVSSANVDDPILNTIKHAQKNF